ncbi:MAG: hypothetical protein J3Q66DRAFT_329116 [Benniella sp.]|nr:MAG: hypothetical protein J3Q66DRAFT_329116 [Benniella sp.]
MKVTSYLTVLASILALGAAGPEGPFISCGSRADSMIVSSTEHTPPVNGKDFCITVKGYLTKAIHKGSKAIIHVTTGNSPTPYTIPICSNSCQAGQMTMRICTRAYFPPRSYVPVDIMASDQDGKNLFCLLTTVETGLRVQAQEQCGM